MQGSPEYLRRLEADITRLREKLGIDAGQPDWAEDSEAFQVKACSHCKHRPCLPLCTLLATRGCSNDSHR